MIWVIFFAIAAVLVYAASKLTVLADQLAEEFGLTKSWVGLLVVGLVTSLPEIATTLSSVTGVGEPDLALGNVFGSIIFNLAILGICDMAFRKHGLLRLVGGQHMLAAKIDVLMLVLVIGALLIPLKWTVGGLQFAVGSAVVMLAGILGFWLTYQAQHGDEEQPSFEIPAHDEGRHVLWKFLGAAATVVICGYALAVTGDKLAAATGLSLTFVGTLFLAVATSLPELIVSITAIRIGAYDLMLGNILGSNIWNVMIIALADFGYAREPLRIPVNLGWGQVFSGVIGIIATMAVIAVLARGRTEPKRAFAAPESLILVALYLGCLAGLFFGRG